LEGNGFQIGTAAECGVLNQRDIRREGKLPQADAVTKGIIPDRPHRGTEIDGCKIMNAPESTISTREIQTPQSVFRNGMYLKFMPNILAISVGGRNTTLMMVKTLKISFCSILMRPSTASNMKLILLERNAAYSEREFTSRETERNGM
jgi:hypothetical protein